MNWDYWLQILGYPLVALGIGLESMGLPTPGETLLLLGGALAANGKLNIYFVIASAALGAILGDNLGYFLGRRHGRAILSRFVEFDETKLAQSEDFFKRHGPKAVFLARFIPIVRMFAAVLAGINHMPTRTFTFYNAAGGVVWAVLMGSLGYFFGQNLPLIERWIKAVGAVIVVLALTAAFLFWLNRRWQAGTDSLRGSLLGRLILGWQRGQRWVLSQGIRVGIGIYIGLLGASGWLFGQLVDAILERDPVLAQLDRAFTPWLRAGANEVSSWLEWLIWLTDVRILLGGALLLFLWLLWPGREKRPASTWRSPLAAWLTLINGLGTLAVALALQVWLQRPAPAEADLLWWTSGYSFPDLPAMLSLAVYGWLAYLLSRQRSWGEQVNIYTVTAFVVLAGGIFTLFLGLALPSDIVGGWTLGLLWVSIPVGVHRWRSHQEPSQNVVSKVA
ncbi:MAG: VTT domain-containing protein [Caldilineaceae bacterium]|nr:VTT domain-containing protein [Caldilineaceae bacterium]